MTKVAQGGERRMVFDVRGRRRHVVRAVYAILAVLMGASLFLVVGPINIGNLINSGGSANTKFEQERAERLEGELVREPQSEHLLAAVAQARIAAGNLALETNPETGLPTPTPEALANYQRGIEAWNRYLKQAKKPSASAATAAVAAYIQLTEASSTYEEADENIAGAVKAQRILAAARPSLGSLSELARYEYFAGDVAAGDKARSEALARVPKTELKETRKKFGEFRLAAQQYEKSKQEAAKAERKQGKEALENPVSGFGGTPSLGG